MSNSRLIKVLLLAASSMTVMAGAIISPALPDLAAHFSDESDVLIRLVLTMPALTITLFGAPMGFLADRLGRIRLLTLALLLYAVAGVSGVVVDNFNILLLSRALLGVAVAAIMSISTTLIGDYFEADERTRFLGTQASFMAMGGIVFLNLGGLLAELSWRGPFFIYLSGLILAPLCWRTLYEPPRHEAPDPALMAGAPAPIDHRADIALAYALGFMGMLLFYIVPTQLPFLLRAEYGLSSSLIGLSVSVVTLTSAMMSLRYGWVHRRVSVMGIYVLAHLLAAAGFLVVGLAQNVPVMIVGLAICGLGFGFIIPNGNVWLMSLCAPGTRGRVIGGFSSTIFLGQFVSPLIVAPLAVWLDSLRLVFVVVGGVSLLVALALIPRLRRPV